MYHLEIAMQNKSARFIHTDQSTGPVKDKTEILVFSD